MIVFRRSYPQAGMPEYKGVTQYYEGQIVDLPAAEEKQLVDSYFAEYYKNENDYYQPYDMVSSPDGTVTGVIGPDGKKSNFIGVRSMPIRVATFGDSTANAFNFVGGGSPAGVPVPTAYIDVVQFAFPSGSASNIQITADPSEVAIGRHRKLHFVFNGGISGDNTTGMLARDTAAVSDTRAAIVDLLDTNPDVVIVRAGINDLQPLTAASSEATIQSTIAGTFDRHKQIVARISAGGAFVIVNSMFGYSLPAKTADWAVIRRAMLEVNALMKAYYSGQSNVVYVDAAGKTYDPATGAFYLGITADGLHPSYPVIPLTGADEGGAIKSRFGAEPARRYIGKNWFRNATFFEEASVSQSYGTVPGGYSVTVSNGTRQNAKIEIIDGDYWFTCEFVPSAAVNATTAATGTISLPFAFSSIMTAAGATANSIAGLEFDFMFSTLDGLPIVGGSYGLQLNFYKTVAGTQNGRIVYQFTSQGGANNTGSLPALVKSSFVLNPFKVNEPPENIDDTRSNSFGFALNIHEQRTFKLGIKNPRLVFLDQTFFNA